MGKCQVPFVISDIFDIATSAAYVITCTLDEGHGDTHVAFGQVEKPGEQTEWRVEWSTLVLGN